MFGTTLTRVVVDHDHVVDNTHIQLAAKYQNLKIERACCDWLSIAKITCQPAIFCMCEAVAPVGGGELQTAC